MGDTAQDTCICLPLACNICVRGNFFHGGWRAGGLREAADLVLAAGGAAWPWPVLAAVLVQVGGAGGSCLQAAGGGSGSGSRGFDLRGPQWCSPGGAPAPFSG